MNQSFSTFKLTNNTDSRIASVTEHASNTSCFMAVIYSYCRTFYANCAHAVLPFKHFVYVLLGKTISFQSMVRRFRTVEPRSTFLLSSLSANFTLPHKNAESSLMKFGSRLPRLALSTFFLAVFNYGRDMVGSVSKVTFEFARRVFIAACRLTTSTFAKLDVISVSWHTRSIPHAV